MWAVQVRGKEDQATQDRQRSLSVSSAAGRPRSWIEDPQAAQTRTFQTEEAAPGHDDAKSERPGVNIAGHRLLPQPEL
jgi:hypothetical protein